MLAASLNRLSNVAAFTSNVLGALPSASSSYLSSSSAGGGIPSLDERIAAALAASAAASAYRSRLRSVETAAADSDDEEEEDAGDGAWGSMIRGGGAGGSHPVAPPRRPSAMEVSRQGLRDLMEALEPRGRLLQAAGAAAARGRPAALLELEAARDGLRAGLAQREAERAMVMQVGGGGEQGGSGAWSEML